MSGRLSSSPIYELKYPCDKFWREERLYKIKSQMLGTYNLFLNKQQINEDENDEFEVQC